MAFKRTALQPLNDVKPFFDTLLVLEEVLWVSDEYSSQVSEITHISHLNSSHNKNISEPYRISKFYFGSERCTLAMYTGMFILSYEIWTNF